MVMGMSALLLAYVLVSTLIPTIPQYLLISKLGLLDSYLLAFFNFFECGGLLLAVGCSAIFVGGLLSLRKQNSPSSERSSVE